MKITRQQMRNMIAGSDELLSASIKKLVREDHSYVVNGLPEDLFDDMIADGLKTARHYGITAPETLATFVLLMFEFGPQFHRHPFIYPMLIDATREPNARVSAVIERTPAEVWQQCEAVLHRQTWFPEGYQADGE